MLIFIYLYGVVLNNFRFGISKLGELINKATGPTCFNIAREFLQPIPEALIMIKWDSFMEFLILILSLRITCNCLICVCVIFMWISKYPLSLVYHHFLIFWCKFLTKISRQYLL